MPQSNAILMKQSTKNTTNIWFCWYFFVKIIKIKNTNTNKSNQYIQLHFKAHFIWCDCDFLKIKLNANLIYVYGCHNYKFISLNWINCNIFWEPFSFLMSEVLFIVNDLIKIIKIKKKILHKTFLSLRG